MGVRKSFYDVEHRLWFHIRCRARVIISELRGVVRFE
jgi:hypothetical protein